MTETRIPMTEIEHCLICHAHIGKGHDPAICEKKSCFEIFEFESNFNEWAKTQKSGTWVVE